MSNIWQENVTLIKEINDLRRELSQARTQVHDLEAALGIHRKNKQRAATDALVSATTTNKNALLQLELDEKCKVVELQRTEITRLRGELMEMERLGSAVTSRPSSATRLPPMSVAAQ